MAALRGQLIPRAALITPNLPEAAVLLGETIASGEAAIVSQGQRLRSLGCAAADGCTHTCKIRFALGVDEPPVSPATAAYPPPASRMNMNTTPKLRAPSAARARSPRPRPSTTPQPMA